VDSLSAQASTDAGNAPKPSAGASITSVASGGLEAGAPSSSAPTDAALDASIGAAPDAPDAPGRAGADASSSSAAADASGISEPDAAQPPEVEAGNPHAGDPASCAGLTASCGAAQDSCCTSLTVTGGTFVLGSAESTATVATFALDKYEVTVARFRKFVDAYGGPPAPGAGAHPLLAGSGWQAAWDTAIAEDADGLKSAVHCRQEIYETWNSNAGSDSLPINCVSWYEAFAFCAWDGGRLPTEAEWEYAAAGGAEERRYPWGSEDPATTSKLAVYGCIEDGSAPGECAAADILPPGSKPAGAGSFGQLDMTGAMAEWTLDWYAEEYAAPCNNCANLSAGSERVFRGGNWYANVNYLPVALRFHMAPHSHSDINGIRCARDL